LRGRRKEKGGRKVRIKGRGEEKKGNEDSKDGRNRSKGKSFGTKIL
jgi:hypothetical protein